MTPEEIKQRKIQLRNAGIKYIDPDNPSWSPEYDKLYNEKIVQPGLRHFAETADFSDNKTYGTVMSLGSPTGTIAKVGTVATALAPILTDPEGARDAASGVWNSVRGVVGNAISNLGERVSGQSRIPVERRIGSNNSGNGDNGDNGGGKKGWGKKAAIAGSVVGGGALLYNLMKDDNVQRNDATTNVNDRLLQTYYDPATGQMVVHTERGDSVVKGSPNQLSTNPRYVPDSRRQ